MKEIEVLPVQGRRLIRQFLDLPHRIYAQEPRWVPPFRAEVKALVFGRKHPVHKSIEIEAWVAMRGEHVVGRIAAIVNKAHNEFQKDQVGFFGFFECDDDLPAAEALIDRASVWLRERGLTSIRGPVSPSMHYDCAILFEGFDRDPGFRMPYNPTYYPELMASCGLEKAMDLFAFEMAGDLIRENPRMVRILGRLKKNDDIKLRQLSMGRFQHDCAIMHSIFSEAWAKNWGFFPMPIAEFQHESKGLRLIAEPEFILFIEEKGEPSAFIAAVRDVNPWLRRMRGRMLSLGMLGLLLNKRKGKNFRVMLAGARPSRVATGIMAWLYVSLTNSGSYYSAENAEFSWVLESNRMMIRAAEQIGGSITKRYRIYERDLMTR